MTAYQLRSRIRELENQIKDCEAERADCRRRMELWEDALFRVRNSRNQFEEFCQGQNSRVQNTGQTCSGMRFLTGYQEEMTAFLSGIHYQGAMEGFAQTEDKFWKGKEALESREADLKREIQRKEEQQEDLQRKLRYLEREE